MPEEMFIEQLLTGKDTLREAASFILETLNI